MKKDNQRLFFVKNQKKPKIRKIIRTLRRMFPLFLGDGLGGSRGRNWDYSLTLAKWLRARALSISMSDNKPLCKLN